MPDELEKNKKWTRAEKFKVRRLYLVRGLSPKGIAEQMHSTPAAISQMANREGWSALRRETEEKAANAADAIAVQDINARQVALTASIADQGEELVEMGFELARHAASEKDAKGFAMVAGGIGKTIGFTRQALGMDAVNSVNVANLSVIFANPIGDAPPRSCSPDTESETLDI
jgi:hypothetical protein